MVGETLDPVEKDGPIKLVPNKTFCSNAHSLRSHHPWRSGTDHEGHWNESLIAYLRAAGGQADVMGWVCTGSRILAVRGEMKTSANLSVRKALGQQSDHLAFGGSQAIPADPRATAGLLTST